MQPMGHLHIYTKKNELNEFNHSFIPANHLFSGLLRKGIYDLEPLPALQQAPSYVPLTNAFANLSDVVKHWTCLERRNPQPVW